MKPGDAIARSRWRMHCERLRLEGEEPPKPDRGALPIAGLLGDIIRRLDTPETALVRRWRTQWPAVAGSEAARHSTPLAFETGALVVAVENSVWRAELARTPPAQWLARARAACPVEGLRRVVFRVDPESVRKWRAQGESNSSSQDENLVS